MKVSLLLLVFFAPLGFSLKPIDLQEPAVFPDTHESFLEIARKATNFNDTELIFGGQRAQLGAFPYQAFLTYQSSKGGSYICGASIVTTTHVITAAHCAVDLISGKLLFGTVDIRQQGATTQVRQINRKTIFSRYNPTSHQNDIAILEFNPPISTNQNVKIVKIPADDVPVLSSGQAIISGFGTYTFNGDQSVTSQYLLYANVNLVKKATCRQMWSGVQISDSQLCAGSSGRGVGPGDSGGPIQVFYNNELYQVGLASFVAADNSIMQYHQDKIPGVFARASSYCDFITQVTGGAFKCTVAGGNPGNPNCPPK